MSRPAPAPIPFDAERAAHFRFRPRGDGYLVTNDFGRWRHLSGEEFRLLAGGKLDKSGELYRDLAEKGFIRDQLNFEKLASAWRKRNRFLWQGPNLHVVVTTLRCNHRCLYCQANSAPMKDEGTDMSLETARKVVDRIFESPSPSLTIEFQGGEPLANWPVVELVVTLARARAKETGRAVWLNLVSNMSLMDDAKLKFLLANDVTFCTSLDGPEDLHNANRPYSGGNSHAGTVRWIKRIRESTKSRSFGIEALLTVTRASLPRAKDIVDEYARLGSHSIYLRPLSPLGMARDLWDRIGYTAEEFLDFYREAFDRILEVNKRRLMAEQGARIFMAKILTDTDPNFLDLRSPCGAGIGQIAYNHDGALYTCDEGRMYARMGDDSFRIGHVAEGTYRESVEHPAVKALSVASCLDNQPDCSRCVYKPYCGVCPIQCYAEQGDIMGRMPTNTRCRINKGILDHLFDKLKDPANEAIFRKWIRPKEDFSVYQRR